MNSPILKVSVIFYVRVIMSGGDASRFIFTFPLQVAMKSKQTKQDQKSDRVSNVTLMKI